MAMARHDAGHTTAQGRLRQLVAATSRRSWAQTSAAAAADDADEEEPVICQMGPEDFQEVCDCANLWFSDHEGFTPLFGRGPSQVGAPPAATCMLAPDRAALHDCLHARCCCRSTCLLCSRCTGPRTCTGILACGRTDSCWRW